MIKLMIIISLFYSFRMNMNVAPAVADHTNADTLICASDREEQQDQQLMLAVMGAKVKSVEKLIADGANVNWMRGHFRRRSKLTISSDGEYRIMWSPLIASINHMHLTPLGSSNVMLDIFDLLLNSGADVNKPCPNTNRTPLMYAADIGNVICVEKLIEKGANIFATDMHGQTACAIAARAGSVDVLKCLIEDYNLHKDSIDKNGRSVLYWAVISKKIEAVRYLLNLGVTITKSMPQEYMTPCRSCGTHLPYFDTVKLNSNPCIAALASTNSTPDMVRLMEEYGCQLHKHPYALSLAVCANRVEVVDYLLNNYKYPLNCEYMYAGPTNCENIGSQYPRYSPHTLLMGACYDITPYKSVEMVKLLLEHGADPNINYGQYISAINVAIYRKHVEVMACFIRSGVNVNAKSFFPKIGVVLPFEAAVWNRCIYATQMLIVSGSSFGVFSLPKEHKCKVDIFPDLQELLKEWNVHKNNVLPLQQRCRMVILNHLSPQADKKITELPLPPQLIRYLSIPELDDIMEAYKNSPKRRRRWIHHNC